MQMHERVAGRTELNDIAPAILKLRNYSQASGIQTHIITVVKQPYLILIGNHLVKVRLLLPV